MSDRSTSPPPSHGVLLDAFRAQQRMLVDNWTSWLGAWQGGWRRQDGDGRSGGNAWDELSRLVGGASRQVSLGPIEPELARRSAELSETALACLGTLQRYEVLHLGALARIGGLFVESLGDGGDDARDPPDSLRGLFERWIECGDRVLLDMYRSDDYLAVQRELLESLMRSRVQWQALQDRFAQLAGRPTREELDDAHRAIHELRRELRAQRREHRELTAAVSALADTRTTAAPRRRGADGSAGKRSSKPEDGAQKAGARKTAAKRVATKKRD